MWNFGNLDVQKQFFTLNLVLIVILLIIVVLLSVQLYVLNKLLHNNRGCKLIVANNENEKNENTSQKDDNKGDVEIAYKTSENEIITKKGEVINVIRNRKKEICEEDLPRLRNELMCYFANNATKDFFKEIDSKDYYRFIDLRENPTARVVVVGDIHCDYLSLVAVLLKLSVSDYDYFNNAYFVFLGDYLDRGSNLFEPLLLLMDLKKILGKRMIMLKGNHESVEWDDMNGKIKSRVRPCESSDCLNEFFGNDKQFLKEFAQFYNTLPIYVYLKTKGRNVLLTHAAIPKDEFVDTIRFNELDGSIMFSSAVPSSECLSKRNKILKDMIWGDPSPYEEKIQVDGRFEFGSKQFNHFASLNNINMMIRSHEEVPLGYKSFFSDCLYTLFSTGGKENKQTCYNSVEPAFAVIKNDSYFFENSFIYQMIGGNGTRYVNPLANLVYTNNQIKNYQLNDEFFCSEEKCKHIKHLMADVLLGFA